jgi:hypothetical protein
MQPEQPPGPLTPHTTERSLAVPDARTDRWTLLRDVVVLQGKLILDGLKDLVLGPVSIVAAIVGLVFERDRPGRHFYAVLRGARELDEWVDLYGAEEHATSAAEPKGLDAHVRKLEALLVAQHGRGGLTRRAQQAIDQAIDALQASQQKAEVDPPDPRV